MMQPLEHLLSPVIKNRDSVLTQDAIKKELALMEKISREKVNILEKGINPSQTELIRPEINESWVRCHKHGLRIYDFNFAPHLEKCAFQELIREKELLLQAADPYIHQLKNVFANTESMILLSDERGVMLRVVVGNHHILAKAQNVFSLIPGVIWTEETVGTCAHGITLLQGTPMQICGPEHYCQTFGEFTCSAAPIYDTERNLAGTLCLVSSYSRLQNLHSLGMVMSMAAAIQNEFQLALNKELLKISLESPDEAILVINKQAEITKVNMTAKKYFNYLDQDLLGMQVEAVLGKQPLIKSVLETGQPVFDAEIAMERWSRVHLLSLQPLPGSSGKHCGCLLKLKKIERNRKSLRQAGSTEARFTFDQLLGNSPCLVKAINMAKRFACLEANILIQGESGTGKEVFAQAIHNESRSNSPFISVNCAAIPRTLIESELFGYEGGAFTGAERQGRQGKFELAHGGTLFLDEIGDMPLDLQPVLLRVLEEKKVMRVGGSRYIPVDFRLIAATNKNLWDLVENKQFREDLYYRLAVFKVCIPPLRERGPDIIKLVKHFINTIAQKQQIPVPSLSNEAKYSLLQYNWPGNVRQLGSAILYAVNVSSGGVIELEDLPDEIKRSVMPGSRNEAGEPELKFKWVPL